MQARHLLTALPLLWASSASAQEVSFVGKVEDVSGTSNQFFLDCTDTDLTSSLFDLNAFVSEQVAITGDWNGSTTNPSVDVTSIEVIPETFEIGGGAKIGDDSHFGFIGNPGDLVAGFLSLDSAFLPINGNQDVLLIDPSRVEHVDAGTIGGSGILELEFLIPNNPALIGLDIYAQGAFARDGGFVLTNPDCKEIDD